MIWVFGNSHERVSIKDLNDVIYFRQKKQYTDQEFDGSADLKKAIQLNRVIKIEHKPDVRSSFPENIGPSEFKTSAIDLCDLKRALTEVLAENKPDGMDLKELVKTLLPAIAEAVRQEIARAPAQQVYVQAGSSVSQKIIPEKEYQEMTYIPDISADGMISNITISEKASNASNVNSSLEALRKLQGLK